MNTAQFLNAIRSIPQNAILERLITQLWNPDYINLPEELRYYLEIWRKYTISKDFSPVLWAVLGFTLMQIQELQRTNDKLADILVDPDMSKIILQAFSDAEIITPDKTEWEGIMLSNYDIKKTGSSIVAAAEALKLSGLIKVKYSITKIASLLSHQFYIKISGSTLRDRSSKHYQEMVKIVSSILPI